MQTSRNNFRKTQSVNFWLNVPVNLKKMIRKLAKSAFRKQIASGFAFFLLAMLIFGCGTNIESATTAPTAAPAAATTAPTSTTSSLPPTTPPPLPIDEYPSLGGQYNPPDPGQPANELWVDAYELRPNLIVVKAGTTLTWVNKDNKPLYIISDEMLFFGITSPFASPWSYLFVSPGTFLYSVSPYNATDKGVVVVTE